MAQSAKKPLSAGLQQTVRHISPRPPFRLDLTVWALRRQPHNRIDSWDGERYVRIFLPGGLPVRAEVVQRGGPEQPQLTVNLLAASALTPSAVSDLVTRLETMLGTGEDLAGFYRLAEKDELLKRLAGQFIGVRPPRFPSLFEALINAFACQQISLHVCMVLLNRLAETWGGSFPGAAARSFPEPAALASAGIDGLRRLGFSRSKGSAIVSLAKAVVNRTVDLDSLALLPDDEAIEALQELAGVGRWSAEYVLLRGLRRLNIFPGDDVGAQNNLQKFLNLASRPDRAETRRIIQRWEPWQGLVYFHFLLARLSEKGLV